MDLKKWRLKFSYLSAPLLDQSFYLALVAQILLIAFSMVDWARSIPEKSLFSASYNDVFVHHEYYRLITAVFAHASWDHVLGNAVFFVPFAALLVNYFGVWCFPFMTFLAGAIINVIVICLYPHDASVLGVSGVVYFMVAFWLVLYMGIERGLTTRQKVLRTFGLALVEFMPEKFDINVSYLSHLVGFLLGIFIGILYFLSFRKSFREFERWEPIEEEPLQNQSPELFDITPSQS